MGAFPEMKLQGTVDTMAEYPEPALVRTASQLLKYAVTIRLGELPSELRPGFLADVTILVQRLSDVLQVPHKAVLEHGGQSYCLIPDGNSWQIRKVAVGPANDHFVVIHEGLHEGEQIARNAATHRDQVELPPIQPKPPRPRRSFRQRGP